MKNKKVVSRLNLPSKAPVLLSAVTWLMLDRFDAVAWVCGVAGTLIGLLWIAFALGIATEVEKDIFNE